MRDIRFRGKRLDNGECLEGTELTLLTMVTDSKGLFLCDCGNETEQYLSHIENGRVKSCGCLRYKQLSKRNQKHGKCGTRLYRIWRGLFKRCHNKNATDYANYGGRGIRVCDEWRDFMAFYKWAMDNGYKDDLTIERKDVNGNYEPGNCCWITKADQAKNRRSVTINRARNVKGRFVKSA
jgi:hypothetical protein